jgi:hypothetical protein
MADRKPDLSDPDYRAFAWARYRRLMWWMVLAALVTVIVSLAGLWWFKGPIPIHMIIATSLGVFFSVLLAAALMGLVFLSSGSGHDDQVNDPNQDDKR